MGQEFCQGCRDCTNNNQEEDFSKQANVPLTNINNPLFFNNKTNYSVNEITHNNESFLNNNNNKNESFITNSNLVYYDDNNNHKLKSSNTNLDEREKERLKEIKMNICSDKIKNLFRKLKNLKNDSHQILCKEYSTIPNSEYILDLDIENLDVNLAPEANCLYLGTKFNNKKDGLGLEIFGDTKSKYFGIFRNGRRVDAGQFMINNDLKEYYYYGQVNGIYAYGYGWSENKKNMSYYEGKWKNSMKNGYGIEIYGDNSEYRGTFLDGKKDGIGYYKWNDGSSYQGEWKENKLDGYGIFVFKDGSLYRGEWIKNRMTGIGEFSNPGIKSYIGFFNRDIRNGFGMLIWHKVNKAFIGFWRNNNQNGIGKFIVNNKIRYGIWKDGELFEKIQSKEDFDNRLNQEEKNYWKYFQIEDYDTISQLMNNYIEL